jgi:hypothetical protein
MPISTLLRPVRGLTLSALAGAKRILLSSCSTLSMQVTPLTDRPNGARLVTSPASCLVVGAGPVSDASLLLDLPVFQRPACYGLHHQGTLSALEVAGVDVPQVRIGETLQPARRLDEHRSTPPLPAEEILLIGSRDETAFGRDEVVALQEALTVLAVQAGRYQVTGAPPARSWLRQVAPALIERWLFDLRPMLVSAGCLMFEPRGASLAPRPSAPVAVAGEAPPQQAEPAPAFAAGFTTDVPPKVLTRPGAQRYRLTFRGATARLCVIGPWTILVKGSLVAMADRSGIQPCLARKRRQLREQGVLQPTGRDGLLRVTQHVALPSLTNATRVVTGGNEAGSLWTAA